MESRPQADETRFPKEPLAALQVFDGKWLTKFVARSRRLRAAVFFFVAILG